MGITERISNTRYAVTAWRDGRRDHQAAKRKELVHTIAEQLGINPETLHNIDGSMADLLRSTPLEEIKPNTTISIANPNIPIVWMRNELTNSAARRQPRPYHAFAPIGWHSETHEDHGQAHDTTYMHLTPLERDGAAWYLPTSLSTQQRNSIEIPPGGQYIASRLINGEYAAGTFTWVQSDNERTVVNFTPPLDHLVEQSTKNPYTVVVQLPVPNQ